MSKELIKKNKLTKVTGGITGSKPTELLNKNRSYENNLYECKNCGDLYRIHSRCLPPCPICPKCGKFRGRRKYKGVEK